MRLPCYHLLVYLETDELSETMKSLSLSYTKAINKRFNRVGSLFQGRFQRILITQTEYLITLTRYIHLNPVKANLVEQPEDWEFSSYLEYAELRKGSLPKLELVKEQIQGDRAYQLFLKDHRLPYSPTLKRLMLDE
jgi:hypothetical protein